MKPNETLPQITILQELKSFIPPMMPYEYRSLEQDILAKGCKTPLIVWQPEGKDEYILVDGHNRLSICQKHNVSYTIEIEYFRDLGEVRTYMVGIQNARRNLNVLQRAYMIGGHYESLKRDALDNLRKRDAQASDEHLGETTAKFIARQYATNETAIKRIYKIYKALHTVEKINANALMLCFQCLNSKQTNLVECLAQASFETIAGIKNDKDLFEAIKEGKQALQAKAQQTSKKPKAFDDKKSIEITYLEQENQQLKADLATKAQAELSKPPTHFLYFYQQMPNDLDAYWIETNMGLFRYIKQNRSLERRTTEVKMSDYKPQQYEGIKPIEPCTFEDLPVDLKVLFASLNSHQLTENDLITCLQEYNALLVNEITQTREQKQSNNPIVQHLQQLLDKSNVSFEAVLARFKALSEKYNAKVQSELLENTQIGLSQEVRYFCTIQTLQAKNALQKAIMAFAYNYQNVIITDWDSFKSVLTQKIDELNKKHSKCQAEVLEHYTYKENAGATIGKNNEIRISLTQIKTISA